MGRLGVREEEEIYGEDDEYSEDYGFNAIATARTLWSARGE